MKFKNKTKKKRDQKWTNQFLRDRLKCPAEAEYAVNKELWFDTLRNLHQLRASGLQTGGGSSNHRAARSWAWQTRLRAVSPESLCEVDPVCPEVWSMRRFSVSPESTSQENTVSPQPKVQVWSVENLVRPESKDLVWEKLNQPRMKRQWSRKNQGLSKVQVWWEPSWCQILARGHAVNPESRVHFPGEKCQFSGLIWGKLSRSWVQTWFVQS